MRRAFVFNQEKCMGCNTCTVSCKDWNQVNPGPVRWRKQLTHETDAAPFFFPLAMSCNHCAKPACKDACGAGAIVKRESDGIVYVDRDKCIGLHACISACPFAEPQVAEDQQEPTMYAGWQIAHPMQKCNFCMERVDKGQNPVCIDACPAHALEMGDYDNLKAKYGNDIVELNKSDFPYAYVNTNTTTGPSFFVKKRGDLKITVAKK